MLQENILKKVPQLYKSSHRLLNVTQRILRSPMSNEHPAACQFMLPY